MAWRSASTQSTTSVSSRVTDSVTSSRSAGAGRPPSRNACSTRVGYSRSRSSVADAFTETRRSDSWGSRRRPRDIGACGTKHLRIQLVDQIHALRERDENRRGDVTARRVAPAGQRLDTDALPGREILLRLVRDVDLRPVDRRRRVLEQLLLHARDDRARRSRTPRTAGRGRVPRRPHPRPDSRGCRDPHRVKRGQRRRAPRSGSGVRRRSRGRRARGARRRRSRTARCPASARGRRANVAGPSRPSTSIVRPRVPQPLLHAIAQPVDRVDAVARVQQGHVLDRGNEAAGSRRLREARPETSRDPASVQRTRHIGRPIGARERRGDLDPQVAHAEGLHDVADRATIESFLRDRQVGRRREHERSCLRPRPAQPVEQVHPRLAGQRDVDEHEVVSAVLERAHRRRDTVHGVALPDRLECAARDEAQLLVVVEDQYAGWTHVGACSGTGCSNALRRARVSSAFVNGLRSCWTPAAAAPSGRVSDV